jgi:hypothetical protein
MTFSVSEFKSKLQKYGGVARKNLFVVEIYDNGLTSQPVIEPGDLRFFCKSATLPGINVTVQDYFPNGFGLKQSIPVNASTGDVNLVFMLDSDHKVLSFFHRWMQKVVNYDVSGGIFSSVDDQLPFEFGYKNEYTTTINIKFYSTDSEQYYEYVLYDAFPTQVSPVDVSWDDNDSYATITVNIAFSNMKVTAARTGTPSSRFSRGQGLLEFLNTVGRTAQLINQNSSLPKTIQDSVNSFTRVKNVFDTIKSIF